MSRVLLYSEWPVDRSRSKIHPMKNEATHNHGSDPILRGVILIVVLGVAVGIVHNWVGLMSMPAFGVDWISRDRTEDVFVLGEEEDLGNSPEDSEVEYHDVDDPMAMFEVPEEENVDLPAIPEMNRPIQIQLPVVKKFFDASAGFIIDARDPEDYKLGRIPGAVNLSWATADPAVLESLDTGGQPIIIYCGEEECEVSLNLAWLMLDAGHRKVTYFEKGFQGWVESGYPVEGGE